MELGSIHPDEQSARRAVATLIGAGIEPERVKVIRPRPTRAHEATSTEAPTQWHAKMRDVSGGVTFGAAVAALACLALTIVDAPLIAAHAVAIYAAIVVTGLVAGASVALLIQWRYRELAPFAHPRVRRSARGWAVVVHARDVEQRALAARALARASHPQGPVAA